MAKQLNLKSYLVAGQSNISNLVLKNYKKIGLNENELTLYLQLLMFQQQNNLFPDMNDVAKNMGITLQEVYSILQQLLNKQVIKLMSQSDEEGRQVDFYDLNAIYERVAKILSEPAVTPKKENNMAELYQTFEQEFGRMLSPIERETIGYWVYDDKYQIEIIKLALKEAVLNQAYNLKYIDRVLMSWERKNLRSKEQVLQELNYRQKQMNEQEKQQFSEEEKKKQPEIPLFNWLDS